MGQHAKDAWGPAKPKQEGSIKIILALDELKLVAPIRVAQIDLLISRCKVATGQPDIVRSISVGEVKDRLETVVLSIELAFRAIVIDSQLLKVRVSDAGFGNRWLLLCLERRKGQIGNKARFTIFLENHMETRSTRAIRKNLILGNGRKTCTNTSTLVPSPNDNPQANSRPQGKWFSPMRKSVFLK